MNYLIEKWFAIGCALGAGLLPFVPTLGLADSPEHPERFGFGRTPSASEIEQWDIDVSPRGDRLPAGQGTVDEGERVYRQKCLACHGPEGRNGVQDVLVGLYDPDNNFANDRSLPKTIGNYWPFATTIYDYVNRTMPMTNPGSLTPNEVYSLVAYLLFLNGIVEKDTVIDAVVLPTIRMPATDLFYWSEESKRLTR